jgi:hypothetical protein
VQDHQDRARQTSPCVTRRAREWTGWSAGRPRPSGRILRLLWPACRISQRALLRDPDAEHRRWASRARAPRRDSGGDSAPRRLCGWERNM